jgi:hypothetical protein
LLLLLQAYRMLLLLSGLHAVKQAAAGTMDAGQCANEQQRFGLLAVTQKL